LLRLRRAEEACQLFGLADGEAVDVNAHVILFDVLVVPAYALPAIRSKAHPLRACGRS
jgi:hypothetical protein